MKTTISFLALFLLFSTITIAQEWWNPPNELRPTMHAGSWENDDGGYTTYFADTEADNQVVIYAADGTVMYTDDEGEMRKAMEAAENGQTYTPTGSDADKWTVHEKGTSAGSGKKEGRWSRILRFLGLKKATNGIVDGCDPRDIDIWMAGGHSEWGGGIIKLAGKAPVPMQNPTREAGTIARSIR